MVARRFLISSALAVSAAWTAASSRASPLPFPGLGMLLKVFAVVAAVVAARIALAWAARWGMSR